MIVALIVSLILGSICYWAITALPLPPMVKTIATIVLVLFLTLYLLNSIGWVDVGSFGLHGHSVYVR